MRIFSVLAPSAFKMKTNMISQVKIITFLYFAIFMFSIGLAIAQNLNSENIWVNFTEAFKIFMGDYSFIGSVVDSTGST